MICLRLQGFYCIFDNHLHINLIVALALGPKETNQINNLVKYIVMIWWMVLIDLSRKLIYLYSISLPLNGKYSFTLYILT